MGSGDVRETPKVVKKTVWAVVEEDLGYYTGRQVEGLFSTKEKAEKYVEENYDEWTRKYMKVEEWEVK